MRLNKHELNALKMQISLLQNAVGNVIDRNNAVEHITMPDIWEWLEDIMTMMES